MGNAVWFWKGEESEGEIYRIHVGGCGEMFQVRIYGRWYGQLGTKVRGKEFERGVYHSLREAKVRVLDVVNR
jgi:hypothetical protein